MSGIRPWLKGTGPLAKTFMAVAITSAAVVAHRWFYAPYAKRQRYRQAEEWANMIIEQEEQDDNSNNNISY